MVATLGEVLDWRHQLRANDIARRPSMKGPDRGYVDQSPPTPPSRPPTVIPISKLTEAQRVSEEEAAVNEAGPPKRRIVEVRTITEENEARRAAQREAERELSPSEARALALLGMNPPEPEQDESEDESTVELSFSVEPEDEAMPSKIAPEKRKRAYKKRQTFSPEMKLKAVREVLKAVHEAESAGTPSRRLGVQARAAERFGVHQTVLSGWVQAWKARNPKQRWPEDDGKPVAPEKTVASAAPAPAPSGAARAAALALLGEGERTIETVSRELQAALTQVKILKAELKSLLD